MPGHESPDFPHSASTWIKITPIDLGVCFPRTLEVLILRQNGTTSITRFQKVLPNLSVCKRQKGRSLIKHIFPNSVPDILKMLLLFLRLVLLGVCLFAGMVISFMDLLLLLWVKLSPLNSAHSSLVLPFILLIFMGPVILRKKLHLSIGCTILIPL
jgi:hypothetical protein